MFNNNTNNNAFNNSNTFNNANTQKKKSSDFVGNIISTVITPELIEARLIVDAMNQVLDKADPLIDSTEKFVNNVSEKAVKLDNIIQIIPRRLKNNRHEYEINRNLQNRIDNDVADKEIQILEEDNNLIGEVAAREANQLIQTGFRTGVRTGGSSIKHIQKGGQQSLKRTAKSINEFLNSSVTASHILNMVKKGGRTKRRYNHYAKKYKTRRQM
jgi:hypothetical protein